MQAVVIHDFGDPRGMGLIDSPSPSPAAGQVLITVEVIGVGGVDAVIRRGTLGSGFPAGMIPGSEVAGTVSAVGDGVDASWIGQRVWAFTGTEGGYAELAVAHLTDISLIPDGLTSIDAVTLGSAATVAHFALGHAHLTAGESVLIRGAAGSIGIAAVELSTRAGARIVAVTTSSPERGRKLASLGATHVLDRDGNGEADAPTQFDVIIDIVGGADVPEFIDRLAPNGRLVIVGAIAGFPPADFGMRIMQSFQFSRSVATFSLATVAVPTRNAVRTELFEAAVRGDIHAVVHDVLPLGEAAEAHRQMDDGGVFGRIVLTPSTQPVASS